MPIFSRFGLTQQVSPTVDAQHLRLWGPALQVEIGIPSSLAAVLQQSHMPLPTPRVGLALIDTGASVTAVEESVLQAFGLIATDITETTVPGGQSLQLLYACDISFPGTPIPTISVNPVVGIRLAGLRYSALIGRDLLQQSQLIYNGAEGFWTLAF